MESITKRIKIAWRRKKRLELLAYYLNWLSDKEEREKQAYDCEMCRKHNWMEDRTCFIYEKEVVFTMPVIDLDTGRPVPKQERRVRADIHKTYELLEEFRELIPGVPLFELLDKHFPNVCPRSLVNLEDVEFISMEAFCSEYGCLPFEGGMLDQLNILVEAFNIIRGSRSDYEKLRQKKMEQKMKVKSKQSDSSQRVNLR